ncbi:MULTISPECIES: protein L [Pseudomonas]|uniref:Protein L n=1 Tax=Pseudomonas auratipiscis TaxID=3115853 RepID=A0AB35WX93_9PSED|nr:MULTISPECIES: protein L [unclassified Pseudomonas]MEE1869087.1 protein L [Pseudomonas sp. 120P]MEE1959734.1 protein L [Pseudomonas sp. 119P]WVM65173.1 protein L [Pseudomonas putida]
MAQVSDHTTQYLRQVNGPDDEHWTHVYEIGEEVPVSGIYRCYHCGDEITSNKGDPFPPQNKTQHPKHDKPILWQLVVMTQTKGPDVN